MTQDAEIFLVEDDDDLREVLIQVLEEEGFRVQAAENGAEALKKLCAPASRQPAAFLVDLWMPVLDGTGFIERIREIPSLAQIPVLVISASPRAASEVAEHAHVAFMPKPLQLRALVSQVNAMLAS